jgi:hypothetical protein
VCLASADRAIVALASVDLTDRLDQFWVAVVVDSISAIWAPGPPKWKLILITST